jgi:hypothetical protein
MDGKPTEVLGVSEVMAGRECWRLTFDDGSTIAADGEHGWLTVKAAERNRKTIRATVEIAATIHANHAVPHGPRFRYIVACDRVESVPVQCIQVAAADGMFLAGPTMIPTHNSDMILGLAICEHKRSLILRREAAQLVALIDRTREIIGQGGKFNGSTNIWRLPGGRQIELGGCANPGDEQKFRGRPHDLLAIDEADQVPEHVFRFLQGWLRTTVPGQRCRVVVTFNPPSTADGRWLLSYFGPWIDPRHPHPARAGELRWYATLPSGKERELPDGNPFVFEGETITPKSRTFIPSRVTDNPYFGPEYIATLQGLPEPLRSQLLYGDFRAGLQDDAYQVIPTAWVEAAMARWTPDGHGNWALTALGVDVAYGGDDQTVLSRRVRTWFAPLEKHPGRETPDGQATAGLILANLAVGGDTRSKRAVVNIDAIGYGASAYDIVKGQLPNVKAVVSSKGTDLMDRAKVLHFADLRAWGWWSLREALDPTTGDNLALPPDPELLADLTAPRWRNTASGIRVESKVDFKTRLGRSPDVGDAVMYAHLETTSPGGAPPSVVGGVGHVHGRPLPMTVR